MSLKGEQAFDSYFSQVYGERWPTLKEALLAEGAKVGRRNLFFDSKDWDSRSSEWVQGVEEKAPHSYILRDDFDLDSILTQTLPLYRMDPASIFAARALDCKPGESVLDMCAAPGGKTLVLLEDLFLAPDSSGVFENSFLVANEMSAKRRHRLMSVIKRYIPKDFRGKVEVRGLDGSILGLREKARFDRILLDAPCSGERGLLHKPSELALWTEKRSRGFAMRQYSLLASAFAALKPGGTLVYSTCSISPHENDGVIAKLFKKQKKLDCGFQIEKIETQGLGDETEYGRHFLPDKQKGWGPIYFSKIKKLED